MSNQAGTSADEMMAARYGTRRPGRRLLIIVLTAILATVFLVWLAWTAWFHSTPAIRGGLESFTVRDARAVDVTFEVRGDGTGYCLLRATAADHVFVGELNARVDRPGKHRVTVRTEREATTVELVSCRGD